MKKLLNQFNNFCYPGKLIIFKNQGTFEIRNPREYRNCGTKFDKKPIFKIKIIESIQ